MVPVSSFPLLRLPKNATMVILRIMNHLQLFGISLASREIKRLVQSLKLKPFDFIVYINAGFSFWLTFKNADLGCIGFKSLPNVLEFSVENACIKYRWSLNAIDRRTIMDHLKFIFNTEKIKVEFLLNYQQSDFEPILKGRRDIESISLRTDNQEEHQRILNFMKPSKVSMPRLTSVNLLVQNIEYLFVNRMEVSLETLLMMNSRNFVTFSSNDTSKLLNRFLKLWTRGSNLQLESLKLNFRINDDFLEEKVFYRLKTTENDSARYFKSSASRPCRVTGGIDIVRFDGTMATIVVHNHVAFFKFAMFVWHDHCIAKEIDYYRWFSQI